MNENIRQNQSATYFWNDNLTKNHFCNFFKPSLALSKASWCLLIWSSWKAISSSTWFFNSESCSACCQLERYYKKSSRFSSTNYNNTYQFTKILLFLSSFSLAESTASFTDGSTTTTSFTSSTSPFGTILSGTENCFKWMSVHEGKNNIETFELTKTFSNTWNDANDIE